MCWSRSRSTGPIRTGCRPSLSWRRAISSACRSARARRPRWCGRTIRNPNPRLDNRLKDVEEKLELPPLQAGTAQLRRLGGELHGEFARHGAAHVPAHGRASRRRARARRRAACRPAAAAHDARARARAGASRRRHAARQERGRARSRRQCRRDRRPDRRGHAAKPWCCRRSRSAERPDPDFAQSGFHAGPERRRPRRSARRSPRAAIR